MAVGLSAIQYKNSSKPSRQSRILTGPLQPSLLPKKRSIALSPEAASPTWMIFRLVGEDGVLARHDGRSIGRKPRADKSNSTPNQLIRVSASGRSGNCAKHLRYMDISATSRARTRVIAHNELVRRRNLDRNPRPQRVTDCGVGLCPLDQFGRIRSIGERAFDAHPRLASP